ncbi:conserved hypothetical protein [Afipia carboxidovorans OM5]|uniref:Uncharacterized protein n=1 Tax=Afipia carboxidovorans (strain ATCC 49405 / DSM 1227 / KCTC 32145 / OM5) TaxID=504832 RepID=B6JEE0_AFIC5|nr:hypothetical protein [Afipia carboxidovorans]ACI92705.1 conserved hypothetical protein [Afipia carboxidovorans OM5]AEI03542.1 hypothetical protein OCA4_c24220 [Afipia carboxidovorans OM4]AEI07119.1 hypothetical protein OCA5_c24230 [Afipia carboxidovorans OM5]BEV44696.1 hypothetical protein CRBSH125_08790 [Afipia carboxidovorans]
MEIRVDVRDDVLKRFGNKLAALGDGQAAVVMSRALNHEGDKGRTQVKRVLVKQTGIKYGLIHKAMRTVYSTPATLTYTLVARGDETNIALFGARQGKRGVSAAPWGRRHVFKSTFIVGRYGGKVYKRIGPARFPLKQVFGPNIARELLKGETVATFKAGSSSIADRVAHELSRVIEE